MASTTDRYPGAAWRPSPNHDAGRDGHPIAACVLHISQGSYEGGVGWLSNPASGVSAHFIISETGHVTQLVDLADTAWANGLAYKAGRWVNSRKKVVTPRWALIEPGVSPNRMTVSIELAGYTDRPRPRAQVDAAVALLAWVGRRAGLASFEVGTTLIGHSWLDNIDRPQCPGRYVDLLAIAAAATAAMGGPATSPYRTIHFTPVLESPGSGDLQVAWGGRCVLPPGQVVELAAGPPGWLHWEAAGFVEAATVAPVVAPPPPAATYTAASPVLGGRSADAARLADAVAAQCLRSPYAAGGAIRDVLVPAYARICAGVGVDPIVALAQCLHETGYLTAALCRPADRDGRPLHNLAGIGVTGEESPTARPGYVWDDDRGVYRACVGFPDLAAAVAAHVGRLAAYATRPADRTPQQAALIAEALRWRGLDDRYHGCAPTLAGLGGTWAADAGYGGRVAAKAETLRKMMG